jgi:predicted anti-sigma-YlaC factor YlaD
MNCTDFLSKMTDYFDGQVEAKLLVEIKAHLAECHHCEVMVDTTKQTIEIYRDSEIYEFSPELRERMRAAIMSKCTAKR